MLVTRSRDARVVASAVGVNIDPTLDGRQQLSGFPHISASGSRLPDALSRDEERPRMDGSDRRDPYLASDRVESVMQHDAEVSQPHYTFRRRGLASLETFSRGDRWYVVVDAVGIRRLSFMAGVAGAFAIADVAGDHLPNALINTANEQDAARRRRRHVDVVKAEAYNATLQRSIGLLDLIGPPARLPGARIVAAHSAAEVLQRALLRDPVG